MKFSFSLLQYSVVTINRNVPAGPRDRAVKGVGFAAARILRMRVRSPPVTWTVVGCNYKVQAYVTS
jgi:hypothetical protein